MDVRIYQPSKNAMQSGRAKYDAWLIEPLLESARVPEPVMGWVSSADTLNQVRLKFATSEAAIAYAEKKGWGYEVDETQQRTLTPRNYADNFRVRKKA